jgi:Ribonuclease G/E
MYVDIGSKRDGLVHVKDMSKDYFISNHQSVSDAAMSIKERFIFLINYGPFTLIVLKCPPASEENIH